MRKGSKLSLRKQAASAAAARGAPLPPRSPLSSAAGPVNVGAASVSPRRPHAPAAEELIAQGGSDGAHQAGKAIDGVLPDTQPADDAAQEDEHDRKDEDEEEDYADEDDEDDEDDDDDDFDVPSDNQGGVEGLAERLAIRSGALARPQRTSSRRRRSSGVDLDAPISADVPEADLLRRQRNIAMMEANACVSWAMHLVPRMF